VLPVSQVSSIYAQVVNGVPKEQSQHVTDAESSTMWDTIAAEVEEMRAENPDIVFSIPNEMPDPIEEPDEAPADPDADGDDDTDPEADPDADEDAQAKADEAKEPAEGTDADPDAADEAAEAPADEETPADEADPADEAEAETPKRNAPKKGVNPFPKKGQS
jgi:hypothetical protein